MKCGKHKAQKFFVKLRWFNEDERYSLDVSDILHISIVRKQIFNYRFRV